MNRRSPGLLPFGDKNAMLVIVFLVLSLGVGSLTIQEDVAPVSSLHPALVTINQETQGFLGIEKLVFMNINGDYFVAQPELRTSGLAEHSIRDATNFLSPENIQTSPQDFIYSSALSEGSTFWNAGANPSNTAIAPFIVVDQNTTMASCSTTMRTPTPTISMGGRCTSIADVPGVGANWVNVSVLASEDRSRCFRNNCNYERERFDLSFSGVESEAWNGAALSFTSRAAFRAETRITGLLCYLNPTVQSAFLNSLNDMRSRSENAVAFGQSGFLLFEGERGYAYLEDRISANSRTSIVVSVFDPNRAESVTQTSFHFDGISMGSEIQDGVIFPTEEACEATSEFARASSNFTLGGQPPGYPTEILRAFVFTVANGEVSPEFGVDRIERR